MALWNTIKSLFIRSAATPLSVFTDMFAPKTKSGAVVNDATVLGITAVWRAVRIISETMASLPFNAFIEDSKSNIRPYIRQNIGYLASTEPSKLYTGFTFRETMMFHLCFRGNFYARIHRDGNGKALELEIINPDIVTVKKSNKTRRLYYEINTGEEKITTLIDTEIIHIPAFAWDGLVGKSPIQAHRESLGLAIANTGYANELYGNGAKLSGVLSTDSSLTPEQISRLKESWSKNYEGSGNKGKTAILEVGMKYSPVSLSPADAQYVETAKLTTEDVARIFGVPMHMLSALDRATFNNIEQLGLDFVVNTIRPWAKRIEEEFTRKLIHTDDKSKAYFRFNLDGLMRGDTAARAAYYRTMFNVGAMSPNDIRRLENMNTVEGGDTYFVPLNMVDESQPTSIPDKGQTQNAV